MQKYIFVHPDAEINPETNLPYDESEYCTVDIEDICTIGIPMIEDAECNLWAIIPAPMQSVTVVEVVDGVPSQVVLFTGLHEEIVQQAEKLFLQICRENIWNFEVYTESDINAILEDGYAQWGNNSVAIVWP